MMSQDALRRLVIATRSWPLLGACYRAFYIVAVRLGAFLLAWPLQGAMAALYLRRGLAARGLTPGVSDVDLLAVLRIPLGREEALLRGLWRRYRLAKRIFPMLGELQIVTPEELRAYLAWGGVRRLEAPAWRPLRGGSAPLPSQLEYGVRRGHLREALAAQVFLSQTYFESARGPAAPDFGFRMAKGFLDVLRHTRAAQEGQPAAMDRGRALRELTDVLPAGSQRVLGQPQLLGREEGLGLVHAAMIRLDALCGGLAGAGNLAPGGQPHAPPPNAGCDEWPDRLSALGPGAGVFMDTLYHWLVVLPEVPGAEPLRRVAAQMDAWHRDNNRFQSAGWLVTRNILQGLFLVPHLDTPFFAWAMGGADRGDGLWIRALSRHRLWAGHYRLRWRLPAGLRRPSEEELLGSVRQAAVELSLSLRLFGLASWAGGNSYRLFFLYSRILGLRLFLERGLAGDPHDIDSLLDECAKRFPDAQPWLRRLSDEDLQRSAAELDAQDSTELFYRHLPFLRAQSDAVLAALGTPPGT